MQEVGEGVRLAIEQGVPLSLKRSPFQMLGLGKPAETIQQPKKRHKQTHTHTDPQWLICFRMFAFSSAALDSAKFGEVPREEIFLTTKIWPDDFGWEKAFDKNVLAEKLTRPRKSFHIISISF